MGNKTGEKSLSTVVILLVISIVALVGIVIFLAYDKKDTVVTTPATNNSTPSESAQADADPSESTPIDVLVNRGDYFGLAVQMTDTVKVIKEGTDANGSSYSNIEAAAVISDFYSKSDSSGGAELPWDFISIGAFKSDASKSTGAIKEYIEQGHIAVSKNDWVLAYNLDGNQKITSFYMSPSVNMSK